MKKNILFVPPRRQIVAFKMFIGWLSKRAWLIPPVTLNGFPWPLFTTYPEHVLFVSAISKMDVGGGVGGRIRGECAGSICLLSVFRVQLNVIVDVKLGSGSFRSTRWYFLNKLVRWRLHAAFIYGRLERGVHEDVKVTLNEKQRWH